MKNGFTLIELLVVIAIISIIAAFMMPNFLGVQDRAKEAGIKAVMHSIQLAVEAYNMENEAYPMGSNISIRELIDNYLTQGGYVTLVPKNPFTGKEYAESDKAGKIIYVYDDSAGSYKLTGYKRNGMSKLLELGNM
ncbi:MAG: prepilin-type N-terminal cleavage/methylation domain-containing protein [bacterium]